MSDDDRSIPSSDELWRMVGRSAPRRWRLRRLLSTWWPAVLPILAILACAVSALIPTR